MPVWIYKTVFFSKVHIPKPLSKVWVYSLLIGLTIEMGACSRGGVIPIPPPEFDVFELIKSLNYRQSAVTPDSLALDSLVKYLKKYPDLTVLLQSSHEHTFFAPTNKAFKELLKTPIFSAIPGGLDAMNPDVLKTIITYHMVDSMRLAKKLIPDSTLTSLSSYPLSPSDFQKIKINHDGTLRGGRLTPAVRIQKKDDISINGVVHVISSVLLPPSVDVLPTIVGTIAFEVMVRGSFSKLAKLIQLADKEFQENTLSREFKIQTLLTMSKDDKLLTNLATLRKQNPQHNQEKILPPDWLPGITFLAVSNNVIQAIRSLNQFILRANSASARSFLLNHIIFGRYKTDKLKKGTLLYTAFSGFFSLPTNPSILTVAISPPDQFSIINPYGIELSTSDNKKAYIYQDNNLLTANGGAIHVIYDLTQN